MPKSENKRLADAINALKIKKSEFALLIERTPVCISSYLSGRQPIPAWVWVMIEDAKSMSAKQLKLKIEKLKK